MLCSKNAEKRKVEERKEERKVAVNRILNLQGVGDEGTQVGNSSLREKRTPEINPYAKQLSDLITWNFSVTELSL